MCKEEKKENEDVLIKVVHDPRRVLVSFNKAINMLILKPDEAKQLASSLYTHAHNMEVENEKKGKKNGRA